MGKGGVLLDHSSGADRRKVGAGEFEEVWSPFLSGSPHSSLGEECAFVEDVVVCAKENGVGDVFSKYVAIVSKLALLRKEGDWWKVSAFENFFVRDM